MPRQYRHASNDDDRVQRCIYISPENADDNHQSHAILARPGRDRLFSSTFT